MNGVKRHDAGRPVIITILLIVLLALATGGCGKQMARMEANQVKLQAMVMANARQLATVSSQVHVGQNELNHSLARLDEKADGINSEVRTVQKTQNQMHETMVSANLQINRKLAQLENNQAFLKDGVAQVANIAQNTNSAVGAVARDQATLHRLVQNNKKELDASFAAVAQNQQRTHTGIDQLQEADRSLASQITGVAQQQHALRQLAQDNHQQTADRLATLDQGQTALQDNLTSNTQTLAAKLAILEQHNLDIQSVVDRVANTTTATAHDITAVAATQAEMRQAQGTRYDNLTGQLATVTQNQRSLQTGIGTLDQKADRTASQLTTLAAGQSTIQETMHASNTAVGSSLAQLSDQQKTLHGDVQNIAQQSGAIAVDLDTALANQAAMQNTLADNRETFAAFAENQTTLQGNVSDLNGKADALTSHVASVATELSAVHETVTSGNEAMAAQVATLAANQQGLKTDLGHLSEQTDHVVAGQTTLGQTLQSHADAARAQMSDIADDQETLRGRVDAVMATASQLALSLVTMTNKQGAFEQDLNTRLANLDQGTDQLAAGQDKLNLALQDHSAALAGQYDNLATDQQTLRDDVSNLTAKVDQGQQALAQSLQAHHDNVADNITSLAQAQERIQGGLDAVAATTTQVALDIITLDDNQGKLELTAQADRAKLNAQLADVAQSQQHMQSGLDTLSTTTTQVALDVVTLDDRQTKLQQAAQADRAKLTAQLSDVAQNQQQMQSGLDALSTTTTQVALDVVTLSGSQSEQAQSAKANHQELVSQLASAANGQQQMQGSLDVITATTSQVGLDVMALDDKQSKIGQTLQAGQQQFGPRLMQLADSQQQIQAGLDTLTSTTAQMALDVITLDSNHAKQGQALEARQQELGTQLQTVAQGQQQMQSNLDTVTATTSQVALDVITLDENQGRIEDAVQANRQELATRLTEIAQGQQQWLARFDAAEARIATMTDGITALEQRVANLQGTLQASLNDLGTLLDTESQQRVQFQDSVRQDMQGVADSVAQLREIQAGLAEHIQRVQDSTENQSGEILSALEQLQKKSDAKAVEVDPELKSSMASPQEIRLP